MNKLQVVVPIGIGAPGTPVQKFFEDGINSLLSQTEPVDICIAADENIPDRIKDFITEKNLYSMKKKSSPFLHSIHPCH